jgi:hypothetical protein
MGVAVLAGVVGGVGTALFTGIALALDEERERAEPVAAVTGSVSGTVVGPALGSADG